MIRRLAPLSALVLAAALALSSGAPVAGAQERLTADVLAARVQTFYDQTRTVRTRFQQHFWNRVYDRTQSSTGTLAIRRQPEASIRFDYEQPSGKVLVSDRGTWTMYEPGDDGAPGQYAQGSSAAASQSAFGFLMGTAQLGSYRRSIITGGSRPPSTDVLELVPRRPDPHYRRIRLYVDNTPEALGVVRRVSIEDPDGNWNRFDFIGDPEFNRELPAGLFTFTPPAGARELAAPGASTASSSSSRPRAATAPTIE